MVDRLANPALADLVAVTDRLAELEVRQRDLKGKIADLTLHLRQRREHTVTPTEVVEAFREFDSLWSERDFEERRYAIRLLVKDVRVAVRRKAKEGTVTIEA